MATPSRHFGEMTLRASRRGLVPPFIAMDVMRAANALTADERSSISKSTWPAPRRCTRPLRDPGASTRSTTTASAIPTPRASKLRDAIRRQYLDARSVAVQIQQECLSPQLHRRRSRRFSRCVRPALQGRPLAAPGYSPAYRNILSSAGPRNRVPVEVGEDIPLPAEPRASRRYPRILPRAVVASPPTRRNDGSRAGGVAPSLSSPRARHPPGVGRDLYHGITYEGAVTP